MLVGVVPFGLVAGASPAEEGLGAGAAIGFSTIVFAGASQLAAIDVLGDGGRRLVAAVAAWTINLRMLLYSASLAPHLADESLRTRLGVAYVLTDQAYAVSITRWDGTDDPQRRVPYYLGAALTLWGSWQLCTIIGALAGPVGARGRPPRVRRAAGVPRAARSPRSTAGRRSSPRSSAASAP